MSCTFNYFINMLCAFKRRSRNPWGSCETIYRFCPWPMRIPSSCRGMLETKRKKNLLSTSSPIGDWEIIDKYSRGATRRKDSLNLRNMLGTPWDMAPAKAFCSCGLSLKKTTPRILARFPNSLPILPGSWKTIHIYIYIYLHKIINIIFENSACCIEKYQKTHLSCDK